MNMYDNLLYKKGALDNPDVLPILERLSDAVTYQRRFVLAIDGDAAAGKSTLAEALRERFGGSIIHMDDFFLPAALRTRERLSSPGGNIDYERFSEEVLAHLSDGVFSYRIFDCSIMDFNGSRSVNTDGLLIVEGAYALHPSFAPYWDTAVFCTIEKEFQLERIRKRNGAERASLFESKWIPLEKAYQSSYGIREKADFIYRAKRSSEEK